MVLGLTTMFSFVSALTSIRMSAIVRSLPDDRMHLRVLREVADRVGTPSHNTLRILDIQCGNGRATAALARTLRQGRIVPPHVEIDIVGVDDDPAAIRAAAAGAPHLRFICDAPERPRQIRLDTVDWFVFQGSFGRIDPSLHGRMMDLFVTRTRFYHHPHAVGVIFRDSPADLPPTRIRSFFEMYCPNPYEMITAPVTSIIKSHRIVTTGVVVYPGPAMGEPGILPDPLMFEAYSPDLYLEDDRRVAFATTPIRWATAQTVRPEKDLILF